MVYFLMSKPMLPMNVVLFGYSGGIAQADGDVIAGLSSDCEPRVVQVFQGTIINMTFV